MYRQTARFNSLPNFPAIRYLNVPGGHGYRNKYIVSVIELFGYLNSPGLDK